MQLNKGPFNDLRYDYVKPKVNTNNPRPKISKEEYYRRLREWQFQRAKGTEEWNKRKKGKIKSSKYKKYQVLFIYTLTDMKAKYPKTLVGR